MRDLTIEAGKRFARLTTRAVVARPRLWRLFRGPLRRQFDALAPEWSSAFGPETLAGLTAALDRLEPAPGRILDLGTGTGKAARLAAERFPQAEVTGVDLSPGMIDQAVSQSPPGIRFQVADASALPHPDGAFDLVLLVNMIPFFAELARVTTPGGAVLVVHLLGPSTPIWTPPDTLRAGLAANGFGAFEELDVGPGTALLARKEKPE